MNAKKKRGRPPKPKVWTREDLPEKQVHFPDLPPQVQADDEDLDNLADRLRGFASRETELEMRKRFTAVADFAEMSKHFTEAAKAVDARDIYRLGHHLVIAFSVEILFLRQRLAKAKESVDRTNAGHERRAAKVKRSRNIHQR